MGAPSFWKLWRRRWRAFTARAEEKWLPRGRHWERETGLKAAGACIRHFQIRLNEAPEALGPEQSRQLCA